MPSKIIPEKPNEKFRNAFAKRVWVGLIGNVQNDSKQDLLGTTVTFCPEA